MEKSYSQTSAYITSIHTYTQQVNGHISDFTNNEIYSVCDGIYRNIYLVTDCLIFAAAFLGICLTVYGLYFLIKTHHVASVYVINLFITDLLQTSVKMIQISDNLLYLKRGQCNDGKMYMLMRLIYMISVLINMCFMVCISAERYTMIAHPVWDRNNRTMRTLVLASLTVWIVFPVLTIISYFVLDEYFYVCALGLLLLPFPLLMFFFLGTWRALARNTALPPSEQRRILGTLALVLCIYTVLFLPTIIYWFHYAIPYLNTMRSWNYVGFATSFILALNPLADFLFYLLLRRDIKVTMRALFCCSPNRQDNRVTETVNEDQI